MKRKLVQQGTTTLMVSLPSDWIQRFKLKKGQEVDITDVKDHLIIASSERKHQKETILSFKTHTESAIRLTLINAYRAGYDVLTIKNIDKGQLNIIREVLQNYLLGMEITHQDKGTCIIESITEPHEEKFDLIFQKIFNGIASMIQSTAARIKNNTPFTDYEFTMLNIHKYDNFCRRMMTKQNIYSDKAIFFWNFLSLVIHAPRELYHLNKYLDKQKPKLSVKESAMHAQYLFSLQELFLMLRHAYQEKNLSAIEKVHEKSKGLLFTNLYDAMKKNNSNQIILHHIGMALRNLYLSTSPLLGLLLEKDSTS
ncbi:MAG: hypothetical protein AABX64_01910 [Nanoarchaeota archaeon]